MKQSEKMPTSTPLFDSGIAMGVGKVITMRNDEVPTQANALHVRCAGPHGIVVVSELNDTLETVPERYKTAPAKRKRTKDLSQNSIAFGPIFPLTKIRILQAPTEINASYTYTPSPRSRQVFYMTPLGRIIYHKLAFCQVAFELRAETKGPSC
jgi:hypothetical protein